MKNMGNQVLHCCPFGSGRQGGGRTREPIPAEIAVVHGQPKVISLRHACLAAGLLDDVHKGAAVNWAVLGVLCKSKWAGSVENFFKDAAAVGTSVPSADAYVADLRGAVIGWTDDSVKSALPSRWTFGFCPDLNLTLAILSRHVSDIFIAARAPDYSWPTLFDSYFVFDDGLGAAPQLTEAPWSRFKWGDSASALAPKRAVSRRSRSGGGWSHA